jgi:hypothetical protein
MSIATSRDWRKDLGIGQRKSPAFFGSRDELVDATATQTHVLRRAFDLFGLDGVLCADNSPLIYFKQVQDIQGTDIAQLHRRFWNHGGAPILVVIAPSEVQVLSGLTRPISQSSSTARLPGLVETIQRTSTALREFLPAVESGEFFRRHAKSFNPEHRVDRDLLTNLQATREKLATASTRALSPQALDALLCRLVFTCYLFDRGVIDADYLSVAGVKGTTHLRDVLAISPRSVAKTHLYNLFAKLGKDFNGDLFSDDLTAEAGLVTAAHIDLLDAFFRATDIKRGQQSFWPYDFGVIPVETISAIYERFLKQTDKQTGAFYTPRFLAETVLDTALIDVKTLLGVRCLDPACGSGIFLVGLFNRMAEEWNQANPDSRNDRRARELMKLLQTSLFGIDINPTACRITAFSLYLAYLDQLAPRDIRELQKKGRALPRLVNAADDFKSAYHDGCIWQADFFADNTRFPKDVNLVIGNPPWGSIATKDTLAALWCVSHAKPIPDKQIATAFMWKAPEHVSAQGRICFVLPHGTLFNHNKTAVAFQREFIRRHAVTRVLNLVDFRFFLFEEAIHPAVVISYQKNAPVNGKATIDYWAPKADWMVTRAEIIRVTPEDRSVVTVGEVMCDLAGDDAPQIWKRHFWATGRDRRLLDRLAAYPRLRDTVRQPRESKNGKTWLVAEGFQPLGPNDDASKAVVLDLPSNVFIEATSPSLQLFLLRDECKTLPSTHVKVRARSNKNTTIFSQPHVLVAKGFTSVAYADFAVSFQHALRGICGPKTDRDLLIFLAAYLRSKLARYVLFHTSSNWGVYRPEVHVEELLRLPFARPEWFPRPSRQWEIIKGVVDIVTSAASRSEKPLTDRNAIVTEAGQLIEPLVQEYFDILPIEQVLVDDTIEVTVPSIQPTRKRTRVPTIEPTTNKQIRAYKDRLTQTLNGWARGGLFVVHGNVAVSQELGVGIAVLEKSNRGNGSQSPQIGNDLVAALDDLRKAVSRKLNAFEFSRGVKVFQGNRLFITKPIGRRYWTETAALNDADEIAGTILMHSPKGAG